MASAQYFEAAKLIGHPAASSAAISLTILAIPVQGTLRLYQFGCTGDPEEATTNLPFIAIGSGQNLADPFLAFLREIFWKQSQPNTSEGIFATVWEFAARYPYKYGWREGTNPVDDN